MRFFDREEELAVLEKAWRIAQKGPSQMTVIAGRRRVGKTRLAQAAFAGEPVIYWFISRSAEGALAQACAQKAAAAIGLYIPPGAARFDSVFEAVMQAGKTQAFTLIIDECQELINVDPSIFTRIQDVWDRYKDAAHVNLVMSGSIYTMMKRIFQDSREPLFGRASGLLKVQAFRTDVLKAILAEYNPAFRPDDLLALYAFTGGVARYVELFMDSGCTDRASMIKLMTSNGSIFATEGDALLAVEFGKDCGTYLSILGAIAQGRTKSAEIAAALGGAQISGQLRRLEEDYELIEKRRPVLSPPRSHTVSYAVKDPFLRFWFRYFHRHQELVENNATPLIAPIIEADYATFSGLALEEYFRQKLRESHRYLQVGSWWQSKRGADQNEIDIVALDTEKKTAFVAEVKRQRKAFEKGKFLAKVECLKTAALAGWTLSPETCCLTLEDM